MWPVRGVFGIACISHELKEGFMTRFFALTLLVVSGMLLLAPSSSVAQNQPQAMTSLQPCVLFDTRPKSGGTGARSRKGPRRTVAGRGRRTGGKK